MGPSGVNEYQNGNNRHDNWKPLRRMLEATFCSCTRLHRAVIESVRLIHVSIISQGLPSVTILRGYSAQIDCSQMRLHTKTSAQGLEIAVSKPWIDCRTVIGMGCYVCHSSNHSGASDSKPSSRGTRKHTRLRRHLHYPRRWA